MELMVDVNNDRWLMFVSERGEVKGFVRVLSVCCFFYVSLFLN